jgi:hypothetical protein
MLPLSYGRGIQGIVGLFANDIHDSAYFGRLSWPSKPLSTGGSIAKRQRLLATAFNGRCPALQLRDQRLGNNSTTTASHHMAHNDA